MRGKEDRGGQEDTFKLLSHSHYRIGGSRERAGENILSVRESL
jgi:hypothetical protein